MRRLLSTMWGLSHLLLKRAMRKAVAGFPIDVGGDCACREELRPLFTFRSSSPPPRTLPSLFFVAVSRGELSLLSCGSLLSIIHSWVPCCAAFLHLPQFLLQSIACYRRGRWVPRRITVAPSHSCPSRPVAARFYVCLFLCLGSHVGNSFARRGAPDVRPLSWAWRLQSNVRPGRRRVELGRCRGQGRRYVFCVLTAAGVERLICSLLPLPVIVVLLHLCIDWMIPFPLTRSLAFRVFLRFF